MRLEYEMARLAGIVHGVVVQMITEALRSSKSGVPKAPLPEWIGNYTQIVSLS